MKYVVRLLGRNIKERKYICSTIKEAQRVVEDLKAAFPHQFATHELYTVISED